MNETVLLLLAFCVTTEIARELCFKVATNRADAAHPVMSLAASPVLWSGIVLWAVEILAWIQVLQRLPLGIAFPIMTLTFVGVPAAGHALLNERLTASQWAGAVLVFMGVVLVGASGS